MSVTVGENGGKLICDFFHKELVVGRALLPEAAEKIEAIFPAQRPEIEEWCAVQGLNLRPLACEANALPLS